MKNRTMGVLAVWMCTAGAAQAQVNVQGFLSGDNEFNAYAGSATDATTPLGGENNWTAVLTFNTVFASGGYLYVTVRDYGDVVALGGYISTNGGATHDAIVPGMGWESYNAGPDLLSTDQGTTNTLIAAANAANGWVAATAGTAVVGFGLPQDYNGMPVLGCIWDPRGGVNDTVIFRYQIVPAPHSAALLVAGAIAFTRRRRMV